MPIVLDSPAVRRALGALAPEDRREVDAALDWLGGDEHSDEPLLIHRYDLQLFLWYQLPTKLLSGLEHKLRRADALGRFFDLVGDYAKPYAALCRAEETKDALRTFEVEGQRGRTLLRRLLDRSGLEPPDTPLLSWGAISGLDEARVHREAAMALEAALEVGELQPEEPGLRRRQTAVLERVLGERRDHLQGRTALEIVQLERFEAWTRGRSEEHQSLVEPIVSLLREPDPPLPSAHVDAFASLLWLLEQAERGLPLTQTGALGRAVVRAAVERFPDWWSDLFGPPHQEAEVLCLLELHAFTRRARLLRRRGRRLLLTPAGHRLRADPAQAATMVAAGLLTGQTFDARVRELACVALLARDETTQEELNNAIRPVIVAEGWRSEGEPPSSSAVNWPLRDLLALTNALGLVRRERKGVTLALTGLGRTVIREAVRARALAPREW